MKKYTLAVKIDTKVAEQFRKYCAAHGIKQGFFVEKALIERLEKEELAEDLLDFRRNEGSEGDAISLEDLAQTIKLARLKVSVKKLRGEARKSGADRLGPADVDKEIQKVRRAKRA